MFHTFDQNLHRMKWEEMKWNETKSIEVMGNLSHPTLATILSSSKAYFCLPWFYWNHLIFIVGFWRRRRRTWKNLAQTCLAFFTAIIKLLLHHFDAHLNWKCVKCTTKCGLNWENQAERNKRIAARDFYYIKWIERIKLKSNENKFDIIFASSSFSVCIEWNWMKRT